MKKLLCILLILLLCLLTGCGSQEAKNTAAQEAADAAPAQEPAPAAAEKSALQTAFEEGKTLALEKADLPEEGIALGGMPVSLSPDGKTYLWRAETTLYVVRAGQEALPIKAAPEKGVGDPYGGLEQAVSLLYRRIPGAEGVAWSPDGRYALMLNTKAAIQLAGSGEPAGLMLLDAETGEVFLADAYNPTVKSENYGAAYQGAFDRSGKYLYYVDGKRTSTDMPYALKRCDLSTFQTETLSTDYYPGSFVSMIEDRDGNWLVMGSTKETMGRADVLRLFSSNGRVLQKTALPLESKWRLLRVDFSADTGYGLGYGYSQTAMSSSSLVNNRAVAQSLRDANAVQPMLVFPSTIKLLRITPAGIDTEHDWFIRSDAEDGSAAHAEQLCDEAMAYMRKVVEKQDYAYADDEQKARIVGYAEELQNSLILDVQSFCLSPDGHYALLSTSGRKDGKTVDLYRFYLMDLETMALRPVDAPEGLGSRYLYFDTSFSQKFAPCMEWFDDGTLLIYDAEANQVNAWHLDWQ